MSTLILVLPNLFAIIGIFILGETQIMFSDKNFYKKLTKLTIPIAFQSLMLAMVAAADAVMLGAIEQDSMAAVSLATQVQFVQNMILYAISCIGIGFRAIFCGMCFLSRVFNETICK